VRRDVNGKSTAHLECARNSSIHVPCEEERR
jgi:hypothetical protein